MFNVQRAIFQLYSGREHLKATGLQTRKGDLSTRDLGFIYVSSAGQVGCEFLHPTQPPLQTEEALGPISIPRSLKKI